MLGWQPYWSCDPVLFLRAQEAIYEISIESAQWSEEKTFETVDERTKDG